MEITQQTNNKYYNYILFDPRKTLNWSYKDMNFKYVPFYVGKGCGFRCTQHYSKSEINRSENPYKTKIIIKLQQGGIHQCILNLMKIHLKKML